MRDSDLPFLSNVLKEVRVAVLGGNVHQALSMIQEQLPTLAQPNTSEVITRILFVCKCQQFIEYIRMGDLDVCLDYLRKELSVFQRLLVNHDDVLVLEVYCLQT